MQSSFLSFYRANIVIILQLIEWYVNFYDYYCKMFTVTTLNL